ncbi:hypothetical protein PSH28_14465 [Pseudomonas resinovorans]|uniref:hypothetical protein n=1 Tax=Metapseudomonas resinovorans TaxID=53412 RepID=UPI00237F2702|nr:hypothetical protein [Pseudomonas resinovorans]MDE3737807.1 hypothetical protein [Pseudomonas resinovorans]
MPGHLTIQTYVEGHWRDAMVLSVSNPVKAQEPPCKVSYEQPYLLDFIEQMETLFEPAISVNLPLNWNQVDSRGHPAFVYDLAPMVLDPEGVTRVTKWVPEHLGNPDWRAICGYFGDWISPDILFERLRGAAELFRALPDLLVELPAEIRSAPSIPLNNLDKRLAEWGLR